MPVEYNIVEEHGKKVYVIKKKTSFRIVEDLLETDYLGSLIEELLEEDGEINEKLVKGALVSDRKALKAKLAREGIMVNLVLNRFLENEIPLPQYLLVQQYVGTYVFKTEDTESLGLRIKRGINENYFRQKGIKLANLNKGEQWRLESIQDILFGQCTMGHDIRYAFTAVSSMGDRLVFGSTCVGDFFEIDAQLNDKLQDFVSKIKDLTDEYYNDYHAYYDVHKRLDNLMRLEMLFINKLTDGKLFTNQELSYVNRFVENGLPVPRPLARQVGLKIQMYLNHEYTNLYFPDSLKSIQNLVYMLYCFSFGSHGYTKQDLKGFFPTNFLGDRIMPNEQEQLESLMATDYATFGDSGFVNEMALNLTESQFMNILNNVYQIKQLTKAIEQDDTLHFVTGKVRQLQIVHGDTDIIVSIDADLREKMLGLPDVSIGESLNLLVNSKIQLKLDKSVLQTADGAYLGVVGKLGKQTFEYAEDKFADLVNKFFLRNDVKVKADNVVRSIIRTGYLSSSNENPKKWLHQILVENGLLEEFNNYRQLIEGKDLSDKELQEYSDLLKVAIENRNHLYKVDLYKGIKILETVIESRKLFLEQDKYLRKVGTELEKFKDAVKNDDNPVRDKYSALLETAKENLDLVKKHKLTFHLTVLETVAKTGKFSVKQKVYLDKLESVLKDV